MNAAPRSARVERRRTSINETPASSRSAAGGQAPTTLLWLRRDLRLSDNPALLEAAERAARSNGPLLPVYVWEPRERRAWAPGGAARWWLWHSLVSLGDALREVGSRLLLERGDPLDVIAALARATGAGAVVWAQGLDPDELADDRALEATLRSSGVQAVVARQANLLADPLSVCKKDGGAYTVFTPFWRARLAAGAPGEPLPAPAVLPPAPAEPCGLSPAVLRDEAVRPWASGFAELWRPGELGGQERLETFLADGLAGYAADRDRPDLDGSSRLSPHLHWGELTARQVWHAVGGALEEAGIDLEASVGAPSWDEEQAPGLRRSAGAFLRQLGWREFGHHLLAAFPHTVTRPLHERFAAFPWRDDPAGLSAWQRGATGYPVIDAAMRSLWTTGWMHNRVRMLAGSFLVKDLLQPWQEGAAWFWDTLVDADLANNTLGWQWVGGCGADAAPYFRVFNPMSQGLRFDPDAAFVRRWVPELAGLPAELAQAPWQATPETLAVAGVTLGETYPHRLVDHGEARLRALAAYEAVKKR